MSIPNPANIEEFNYSYGDPRTNFLKFILSLDNTESYINLNKFTNKDLFEFKCIKTDPTKNTKKRKLIIPDQKILEEGVKPIVILPLLLTKKSTCKLGKHARHFNIVLYNRITHELERIDIRKYHTTNFTFKILFKRIRDTITPYVEKYDKDVDFIGEIDINNKFQQSYKNIPIRELYPLYLVSYLMIRCKYPQLKSSQIHNRLSKLSSKTITKNWEHYLDFNKDSSSSKCKKDLLLNLETSRCIIKSGSVYNNLLLDKPVKNCPDNKIFDILTNRCTSASIIKTINIMLDDVLHADVNKKTKFKSLGQAKSALLATMFVLSKYKYGYLINPHNILSPTNKNSYAILWSWNKAQSKYILSIPDGYWNAWNEAMYNHDVRFIITLVSLTSSQQGFHANVLIYDKVSHEMERFDGLGSLVHESFGMDEFDEKISAFFNDAKGVYVPIKFKYFKPIDYCPKVIYQYKEMDEIVGFKDTSGSCANWRLWYIDIRLANPNLTRKQVIALSLKKIENFGSFQRFIKSYQYYINKNIIIDG